MVGKRSGLVVVVLLALGAPAEAAFQIGTRYLDDRPFEPDTDVLDINDSLYLSIWTDERVWGQMGVYEWAVVCEGSLATISGGEAGPDAKSGVTFLGSTPSWLVPEEEHGQWGVIQGEELEPGLYLDKFVYKPLSVGGVTVRLYEISYSTGAIEGVPDSIVIHQVPEPVTIGFLGLGGLFVLRRK